MRAKTSKRKASRGIADQFVIQLNKDEHKQLLQVKKRLGFTTKAALIRHLIAIAAGGGTVPVVDAAPASAVPDLK